MYKKYFCIALFLVMLASMTCIAASEDIDANNDALANIEDIEVQNAPIDDINDDLSTNYDNEILSDESSEDTGKLDPNLNVNVEKNDAYVTIASTVNENATGNISIEIINLNDVNYTIETGPLTIENGTVTWAERIAFEKGDYVAHILYSGDNNYHSTSKNKVFEITKSTTSLIVNVETDEEFITITSWINQNATGNVTIRIKTFDEENYTEYATVDVENGTATWKDQITFDKGDYVAFTTYNGDENYFKQGDTQTFSINKQIPDFDVNITVNEFLIILNATLPENATGNVTVKIKTFDEENYTEITTIEVENGTAIWSDFVPFNKGEYVAYTIYNGDKNYFKNEDIQTFTIEKQVPNMFINSTVNDANATIKITLPENATGVVTLTNNQTGETENVTLNGTSIEFNETLQYGYNVFLIDYSGDDYYFGIKNTVVEPLQIETSLSTKDTVSVTYKKTAKITVKLNILNGFGNITSDGENITIYVNNQTYVGTLKDNAVTIKIVAGSANKFIPNNYTANVTFDGNAQLKNASTSFVLVVNKGTPKLTAKSKSYKVSTKTKKYTITLKNHQNNVIKNTKVTLKVNGKTFKATTNEKGQATFKITNLSKKAKYYAVVNYKGSKYYNPTSKKVTITVK